jgi:hypothetical protein
VNYCFALDGGFTATRHHLNIATKVRFGRLPQACASEDT